MNMQAIKTKAATAAVLPARSGDVLQLKTAKPGYFQTRLVPDLKLFAARVIPPLVMIALLLVVWQLLCSRPASPAAQEQRLPGPVELAGEHLALGHRQLARVVAANVGRGLAVHRAPPLEERDARPRGLVAGRHPRDHAVRKPPTEDLADERRHAVTGPARERGHERDLHDGSQVEVERAEEAAEA